MRNLDLSSWQTLLSTLLGLAVITLIGVGIRLLLMQTVQRRRERENRQINERLRSLMAAYKTLGSSFTGKLLVDPSHLADLLRRHQEDAPTPAEDEDASASGPGAEAPEDSPGAQRARRIRDAVEAALSDIILLGTEEQVVLAARAATDLAAGRPIETAELVVSLRNFIRQALDLEPVPADLIIPRQGPARPVVARGKAEAGGARAGAGGRGGAGGSGGGAAGMGLIAAADDKPD